MKRAFSRAFSILLIGFLAAAGSLFARENGSGEQSRSPFVFDYDVQLFGLQLGVGYRGAPIVQGLDTIFWIFGGGGWQQLYYYRYPDGSVYTGTGENDNPAVDPFYRRANAEWRLGFAQGILFNEKTDKNLLEYFFFYQGRYDYHFADWEFTAPILFQADTVPDRYGILQNSFLTGLSLNKVAFNEQSRVTSGIGAEASVEWGPSFLGNDAVGLSDFARLNLTGKAYLPVFNIAPERRFNLLSGYVCTFVSLDASFGGSIPLNIRQTFGGRRPRIGLGDAVLGADDAKYDSRFKFVQNIEFRVNGPAFIWRGLLAGALVFFDYGYYNNLDGLEAGFLASTGFGIYLHIFNLTSLTLYLPQVLLNEPRSNGRYVTPVSFEFDLQL
ncbi:MAG: hypothetical protein E4H36_08835 [Spirochaetales bacterium]|nr:MAG: hypothetical protein E4H36_08835 [Spirochaetales bacterium]